MHFSHKKERVPVAIEERSTTEIIGFQLN